MSKKLSILLTLSVFTFINWISYTHTNVPNNLVNLVIVCTIAFLSLVMCTIIMVKKINIANFWRYPRKHIYIYNYICNLFIIFSFEIINHLYNYLGMSAFVLLNAGMILLSLGEEETIKHNKKRKEANEE